MITTVLRKHEFEYEGAATPNVYGKRAVLARNVLTLLDKIHLPFSCIVPYRILRKVEVV